MNPAFIKKAGLEYKSRVHSTSLNYKVYDIGITKKADRQVGTGPRHHNFKVGFNEKGTGI